MTRTFFILTDLPKLDQLEVARLNEKGLDFWNNTETAFMTARAAYLTNQIYKFDENGLILEASCVGTPPDTVVGFKKGATIIQTDATDYGLFTNSGDETSSLFVQVEKVTA